MSSASGDGTFSRLVISPLSCPGFAAILGLLGFHRIYQIMGQALDVLRKFNDVEFAHPKSSRQRSMGFLKRLLSLL